jgi:asparagine synthase (glutamine-hydrolysing)
MSAITGIFYRDSRSVDYDQIKKMNDSLSHRGTDGSKVYYEGSVALGHQMLHTTPESIHETLPFEENGLIITADARIDNRKDLSEKLGIENKEKIPDSYFILKAYQKWGETCPEELLGDFSFVIWDKTNEKLFCARDHMGVKPFYYYLSKEAFFFATEIKALLTIPEVPYKLNELKMAYFLQIEYSEDKLYTFYEDILRLIPAHSLSINLNKSRLKIYWELNPNSEILMDSEEDYITEFSSIFKEAVKCRLRSVFPIGFDLSGGLDSSSIVCMSKIILNKNSHPSDLKTFSYVFDEFPQIDERFYIKKVVDTGGIEAHYILCDRISPFEQIDTVLSFQDQPHLNPFLSIIRNSFKIMHKNGVRTILSGAGGDMVIYSGKNYFLELAITFQWYKLIKEIKKSSQLKNKNMFYMLFNQVFYPLIPEIIKDNLKNLICHYTRRIPCSTNFLNKYFIKKYSKDLQKLTEIKTTKKYHYFSINNDIAQIFFETLDLTSESFSIDSRYPYYDKRLIEFCYAIPTEMKFKIYNRYIQRAAMDKILPSEIQWRMSKADFRPFLTKNLISFEKSLLDMMISNNEIIKDYLDFKRLKCSYQKYKNGKEISYIDIYYIWIATILFLWLKKTNIHKN